MAIAIDPETVELTTTFLLEQRAIAERRRREVEKIDRRIHEDAAKWRALMRELGLPLYESV